MDATLHFDDDTKRRYQQVLSSGVDPVVALKKAQTYQHQKNAANLGNEAEKYRTDSARYGGGSTSGALKYTLLDPSSKANLTKLAPLAAGAVLAPFTGGLSLAGLAGLTGLATGGAEIARQAGNQENIDPLQALKEGVLSGAGTFVGGKVFNAAAGTLGKAISSEATPGFSNLAKKTGEFLNKDVGNIMKKVIGNAGNKTVDITQAIGNLSPEEVSTLVNSGHLPPEAASGGKSVWNPKSSRIEVLGNENTSLPTNPSEVQFGGPQNPSGTPTALENPAAGTTTPTTQPLSVMPDNPSEVQFGVSETPPLTPQPNQITKLGNNMRSDINSPKVKASPTGYTKEAALNDHINEMLGVGNASQKYQRMPAKMKALQSELSTTLGASEASTDASALKASIRKEIQSSTTKVGNEGKRFKEETKKIEEIVDKYTGKDGKITPSDHYKMNKEIADKVGKGFDKNSPGWQGADMNEEEKAAYIAWKNSRAQLGANVPEANPVLSKEQALIEAAPGLQSESKAEQAENLKIFGVKILNAGAAKGAAKDVIGAGLQKLGGGMSEGVPGGVSPLGLLSTAGLDSNMVGNGGGESLPIDPSGVFGSDTEDMTQQTTDSTPSSPFADPNFIQTLILADVQKTGGKNIALIQKLSDMFAPAGNTKLSDTAIKLVNDYHAAISNLDSLESSLSTSKAGRGPLSGFISSHNPYDTEAQSLQSQIDVVRQTVGKALEGGVLRKEDEVKYKKILPTMTDTAAVAANKLKQLRKMLARDYGNYIDLQNSRGSGQFTNSLPVDVSQVAF